MKKELKEIGTTAALAAAVVTTGTFVSQTTAQADVVAPEVVTTNQANATLSVEQAQSAVASAEANVAKAQQHFDDASAAYSATQAQLGPASQQVASAQLSVASAAVALKSAQTETNQLIPDALTTNDRIAADEAASSAASERYSAAAEQVSAAGDAASQAHQAVSAHQIAVDQASSAVQVAQNVAAGVGKQEAQSALAGATTTVASAQALVSDANAVLASAQAVANMAYEKGKSANAALSAARVEATDVHNQFYSADSIRWNAQGKLNSARERLDHAYMGEDVYASETAQAIASAEDTIERAQNNISYATSSIESSRSEYASASAYVPSAEAALSAVTQSVQSASAELASAQSAYDTTQKELSAAQAAVAPAQATLEQAKAELQTAQQVANSGIKLPKGYVEAFKQYRNGMLSEYELQKIIAQNDNFYQNKLEDANRYVSISRNEILPHDVQLELTKYAMALLNPLRTQFGASEFTSNDAVLQVAERIVSYIQNADDISSVEAAIIQAENESGLVGRNIDLEYTLNGIYSGYQKERKVSIDTLKHEIYKLIQREVFYGNIGSLLGMDDGYIGKNELGVNIDAFGSIHLVMVGPDNIVATSNYQSTKDNSPIYIADILEGNNDQLNAELKEKKAAVDRAQAKFDQINSDVTRLANTSGELQNKISNLTWTNSTLAYDLHNAQENLNNAKSSMEWAEESIKRSQEEIKSSQAELAQAQVDLAKLQQDRPQTQQDIINRAKQELQQAQAAYDLADQKYQAATQLDQAKQKAVEQAQAVVDRLVAIARLADKNVEVAKQALADAQGTLTQDQALQTQAQELIASYDWSPEAKAAALQKAQANLAAVEKQLAAAKAEADAKDQALQQAQSEEAQARQAMDETAARLSGDHSQFNQVDAMYYQLVNLQEILVQAQTVLAALHVDHTQNLAALQQTQNEYVKAQQALELAKQRLAKAQATLAMVGMVDSTPDEATNTSGATGGTPATATNSTTDGQNPAWNNGGGTGAPALDDDEDVKVDSNQSSANDDTNIAVAGSSTEKSSSELPSGGTGAPSGNDEWETTNQSTSTSTPDSTTVPTSTTSDATISNGSQAVAAGTGAPSETEPTPIATPAQADPVKAEPTSQTNELPTLTGMAGEPVTENDKTGADPSQPISSANENLAKGAGEQNYSAQGTTGIGEPIPDRDKAGAPHPSNNTVDTKLPQAGDEPTNLTLAQATGLAAATLLTGRAIRKRR